MPYKFACQKAGVSYDSLRVWIKKGEAARSGEFFDFLNDIKQAEGEAVEELLGTIQDAGRESWQASAWILERRHPEEFARREKTELTGRDGGPIQTEKKDGTKERDERFKELFAKLDGYRTGYDDGYREGDSRQSVHPGSPNGTST